ncbi:MAG: hypothetical protein H0Z30_01185 [Candidatus Marinimicrobia bacterium]|nr:hypothetical protein [Candidatus Neomarinimicrobiota bacterium]
MFNRLRNGDIYHEIRKSHHPETGKGYGNRALEKMLYLAYLDISKKWKKLSGTGQKLLLNWLSISKED